MEKDFTVKVLFLNKNKEPVGEKVYTLKEYATSIAYSIKKTIADVEDLCYTLEDYKTKDEWSQETKDMFNKIRHKMLDEANSVDRLPNTLMYKGVLCSSVPAGEMLARLTDQFAKS